MAKAEAPLTKRQEEILSFVTQRTKAAGAPPTIAEIQSYFGFRSPKAVSDHLAALEKKNYIKRQPYKSRAIEIPKKTTRLWMMQRCVFQDIKNE